LILPTQNEEGVYSKGSPAYTDGFKAEAGGQVINRAYLVKEISERIAVSTHSLYTWLKADTRNPKSTLSEKKN